MCVSTLQPDPMAVEPDDLDRWIEACTAAGVDGISYWSLYHYVLTAAGVAADDICRRVDDAGLCISVIEAIAGFANAANPAAAVADAAPTLEVAAAYGAEHVVAVLLDAELESVDAAAANLAAVADEAAKIGAAVSVEYLPWTGIPDIGTCWEILRRTERQNVGVLFDSWHWHRQPGGPGGANAETLLSIPGEMIRVFQMCDAGPDPQPDPMAECLSARPLPGQGEVDHPALFELFREIGADPIISPEVFNADLVQQGPTAAAVAIADACRATLQAW